ncbi:MAG: DNA-primase RepB domain-containing protein [Terriglobia bacterium]
MPSLEHNPMAGQKLTPEEYIRENFEPSDRIAVLVLHRNTDTKVQRVVTAQALASDSWQRWLRAENAQGSDIYISQNALRENTRNRNKEDIATIRHAYLDLDHDGAKSLALIENSSNVPAPSYVITSSPGKFQVIWKVKGMTKDQAESLQRRMVQEFGADPAATDSSRVLRLPGFVNKKHAEPFHVVAEAQSCETYRLQDFKLSSVASEHHAVTPAGTAATRPSSLAARTQSERDWKWAVRHVQQGEPIETVIQTLAAYRDDKANPEYYARRTVTRAYVKVALSEGADPEDVVRTIKAHPPRIGMNGERYARATVEEFQMKLGLADQQDHARPGAAVEHRHAQQLGLGVMPS